MRNACKLVRPDVTVLMAVCDGAAFLGAQLASIAAQRGVTWRLIASDDGSTDASPAILRQFAGGADVTLLQGPRRGHAAHFLALLAGLGPDPGIVALADQDDLWFTDKLARGVAALLGVDGPALYCAATIITDQHLRPRALSPAHPRRPDFRNALVQNIAPGNTIMLNAAAARLARDCAPEAGEIIAHDWWLYQIITGVGGAVICDPEPVLYYRQHGRNAVGANRGIMAKGHRLGQVLRGRYAQWNATNRAALAASAHRFTPQARAALAEFTNLADPNLPTRLRALRRLAPQRQTATGTAALWLATAMGWV